MKVLLLLALAAVGQCALLGSKKCTYGPSYWCSHLHHAKECNAMQHCMTTVWKKQNLDTMIGSSETCFDVIKVLDVVRHATDADFIDQWVMGCTGMPLEKRQLCKELTMEDMAEVYKLLKSDLSSRQVAAALKLCGGYEDTVPHPEQKPVSSDYCRDCVNFMEDLREIFNNTEGQAVAMIKSLVCTNMGPLQSLCDQLVDQYGDMVFSYVLQVVDPQKICQALQLCSNQTHAEVMERLKDMMAKQRWGDMECDLCKTLDAEAQKALSDTTFQNDVFAYIKADVCTLFGSFADKCSSYVDSIGPLVFQVLVSEMDPEKTCQVLHVCPSSQTSVSLFKTVKYKVTKHKLASAECDACKVVVGDIQKELGDATVQKEILTFLKDNLCSRLGSLADQCNTYVDAYGPVLFQILVAEMNPEDICKAIHLCTNQTNTNLLKIILRKMDKGGIECELCQNLAKELQTLLQDPTVQTETLNFLKNDVCTIMASFATECQSYVDAYGPMVFQIVVAELDPATICQTVGLCDATAFSQLTRVPLGPLGMVQILPPRNKVQSNPIECELCKKLVEELKGIIAGKSEQEAKAALEELCKKLPSELSVECVQFVDKYGKLIINYIFQELSPDFICSKIGVCPSEAFVLAVGLQVATKSEKCEVCKEAIDYIKKEVNSSAARTFEKNMLDKVCTDALSKYGWMCQWFVDKYAPAIINMFEEKVDPAAICTVLDLCGQAPSASDNQPLLFQPMLELQPARPHLLGTKQCLYGPSFWCASESNARLCNAEAECKRMKEMENKTKK